MFKAKPKPMAPPPPQKPVAASTGSPFAGISAGEGRAMAARVQREAAAKNPPPPSAPPPPSRKGGVFGVSAPAPAPAAAPRIGGGFSAGRGRGETPPPAPPPPPPAPPPRKKSYTFKKGGEVKAKQMASGGSVSSASKRGDGCAIKGKTKGRMV